MNYLRFLKRKNNVVDLSYCQSPSKFESKERICRHVSKKKGFCFHGRSTIALFRIHNKINRLYNQIWNRHRPGVVVLYGDVSLLQGAAVNKFFRDVEDKVVICYCSRNCCLFGKLQAMESRINIYDLSLSE